MNGQNVLNVTYTSKQGGTGGGHAGINVDAKDSTSVQNATIVNATNASPIVITTATPNTFNTGDELDVYNVGGNTAANGAWIITV